MAKIVSLKARQVFDSRGIPTIEAEIELESGAHGRFITPSGASVGKKEALELRDGDPKKFLGKGVLNAVANVFGPISKALLEREISDQKMLDHILIELDGTPNKSRLGANAILSVSGAFFHAFAKEKKLPLYACYESDEPFLLPMPLVNVINGGAHADNGLDIQEFMITPSGAKTFSDGMRIVAETFYALKALLHKEGLSTAVGDEGGFAPKLESNEEALDLLELAVKKAGFRPKEDVNFAIDAAASSLFDEIRGTYRINGKLLERKELLAWYEKLVDRYPICSIEDPFFEEDLMGFSDIMKSLGKKLQIVGDDIFVTNEKYIRQGIDNHYANAVLIKMNQIGTLTETITAVTLTKNAGLKPIISHRSGETEDTTIADLAVLLRAGQIKTGSMSRSERVAKYNRLLRIEEELGQKARFAMKI